MDLIFYAVPFFFLLIGIELIAERLRGTDYYRVNDSITSLSTGTIFQLVAAIQKLLPLTVYVLFYEQLAMFDLGHSLFVWVIAFIAYDFFYYWNHRCGHEINVLWAAHVVHHSSEEYNLTTALRQTGSGFASVIFYLPLALLGFDPLLIITVGSLNLIYQFWVHTQHLPKLGWFEWVFVTPSNHRAHHAQNAIYVDRNYGGVFIVWDRIFGSYQEELQEEPPVFGIRGALNSWNPLWANLQVYNQLLQDALHTKNINHKFTLWFRRTGWRPPDVVDNYPLKKTNLEAFDKFDTRLPTGLKLYSVLQYVSITAVALFFVQQSALMDLHTQVLTVIFVLLSSFSLGALMEHKRYAGVLESIRLSLVLIIATLSPIPTMLSLVLMTTAILGLPLLFLGRQQALKLRP